MFNEWWLKRLREGYKAAEEDYGEKDTWPGPRGRPGMWDAAVSSGYIEQLMEHYREQAVCPVCLREKGRVVHPWAVTAGMLVAGTVWFGGGFLAGWFF